MIQHTVVFKLKHATGSIEEETFLGHAQDLAKIPSIRNFECLRQISDKNNYDFGLSMVFDSAEGYELYNNHPDHIKFVENIWKPEVIEFLELDYVPYSGSGGKNTGL